MTITNNPWSSGSTVSSKHAGMYQNDNATATSITTVDVWEHVVNFTSGLLLGWTHSAGSLTASTGSSGIYLLVASVSSAAASINKDFEFGISINDTIQAKSISKRRYSSSDTGSQSVSCLLTIADGDIIKLEVRNLTDATNVTIIDCNVCLKK